MGMAFGRICCIAFCQSPATSSNHQDLLKVQEPWSDIDTFGCILSVSVDFYMSSFLKQPLILSSSTMSSNSVCQNLLVGMKTREARRETFSVRSEQRRHCVPQTFCGFSLVADVLVRSNQKDFSPSLVSSRQDSPFLTSALHGQAMLLGPFFEICFLWICHFCDLRKLSLKINQLPGLLCPSVQLPMGLCLPEQTKVCYSKDLQSATCFPYFTHSCLIVPVDKAAADDHILNQF